MSSTYVLYSVHYFTVHLYTTRHQPCLNFVYKTSLTHTWLKIMKNYHTLTTSLSTRCHGKKWTIYNGVKVQVEVIEPLWLINHLHSHCTGCQTDWLYRCNCTNINWNFLINVIKVIEMNCIAYWFFIAGFRTPDCPRCSLEVSQ